MNNTWEVLLTLSWKIVLFYILVVVISIITETIFTEKLSVSSKSLVLRKFHSWASEAVLQINRVVYILEFT